TGPITGSRKVYAAPSGRADIRVPFREITLSGPSEAPVRVSGVREMLRWNNGPSSAANTTPATRTASRVTKNRVESNFLRFMITSSKLKCKIAKGIIGFNENLGSLCG
ncbi:MAG: hypothetical protein MUO62_15715, partial [Anaerolineales bacterium]|nr:hypothetical protein [Anaerolineales bacterium]